ncbi:transposase IS4 domain-containing protein [Phthorimaea operculella]|nr:transposase IS4 domain-containing protein [Phthorimaea operculella]
MKRYVECGESASDASAPLASNAKAFAITPSSPPSSEHPLREKEISNIFNYDQVMIVPRSVRMFMEDCFVVKGSEDVLETDASICLAWPPDAPTAYASPASVSQSSPSPPPTLSAASPFVLDRPTSGQLDYNLNKFKFDWKEFPKSQISPEVRREPFTVPNCGPTEEYSSPYDAFNAIWDDDIMESIAKETNAYAKQVAANMLAGGSMHQRSRITKWCDTKVDELRVFFGIVLAMGIVVKTRIEEYWQASGDIFSTPGFSAAMSCNRFMLLSKCLHFRSNDGCNPVSMTRAEAKLYKLQPILDHLNNKFSQLYVPSQNLALDESLTMWKGWLDINQFIKNKVAAVGIKTYEVCESQTGYLWRFEVHVGRDNSEAQDSPISGIVPALVLKLLNGLEHKGYTVWMDNYYNSPALARELKVRGFDCVGTLLTNRQFVPVELTNLAKNDMAVGQVTGCTSGDVDLLVWQDKSRVAFVSTYHGLATTRCGGDTIKPTVVPDYNVCMGGVDRKDQMLAMYPIERKRTRIWYKKLFRRLLNVSVLNAYILYKQKNQRISHRNFRKRVICDLLSKHGRPVKAASKVPIARPAGGHFPALYDFLPGEKRERQRKVCTVCKKRTNAYCIACNVPLCVFTCFEPHHNKNTDQS